MFNKATKYFLAGKHEKAISCFKKQLADHAFKELYLNMGNAYRSLDKDSEAWNCYTLANSPSIPFADGKYGPYSLALNNQGLMAYMLGDTETSIKFYRAALDIDPLYGEAIWNYAISELRRTNSVSEFGWRMYQYRFNRGSGSVIIDNSIPFWDGVSSGSSICVITEQGLGDKIMFGRYVKLLEKYFSKIYVVCHESLDCLFAPYTCIRSVKEASALGVIDSIPICSLAGIFGLIDERWLDGKFAKHSFSGFNIGCVWSGSPTHANDRNRSCTSNYMSDLASYGNLYALSPNTKAHKMTSLNPKTWEETASYLLGLDVVVSVDTSIVHLAGTLGVPCIMVQPLKDTDFRWGEVGDINPWYKSVTVVPNDNNWDAAFLNVRKELEKLI